MSRLKSFYTADEITNNLYTSGSEYMTEDTVEYVGAYHSYATGERYTNQVWNNKISKQLLPYVKYDTTNEQYKQLKPNIDVRYETPAGAMAVGHGLQDAQKTMGIMTLALVIGGFHSGDSIPAWVKIAAASAISLGTYVGGWRIMKTLGHRMIEVDQVKGLASTTVASIVLYVMAIYYKAPISTTHTITSSILGAGATRGRKWVRWTVVSNIATAWVLTLPAAAACAALMYEFLGVLGLH